MSAQSASSAPESRRAREILVVGGGIAGLTVAGALAGNGHHVRVVELEPAWPTVGWGLSLTGPALRALDTLGLADRCIAEGFGVNEVHNCGRDTELLAVQPMPRLLGPERVAQAGIPRPALREILRQRAVDVGVELRSGVTVEELHDDGRTTFTDGETRSYDLVIGADGVRSAVRALIGLDVTPRYTGQLVWRARVPRPAWGDGLITVADNGANAGMIPIAPDEAYVFHTENTPDVSPVPDERLADLLRERLSNFTGRFAELVAAIVDPAQVVRRPVHVLMADAPWHRGRTVLIGDAVHTPSPQLISGAAIAIEDAVLLAETLGTGYDDDDLPALLDKFAARRYGRCAAVVDASIRMSELERAGRHPEAHGVQGQAFRALAAPI